MSLIMGIDVGTTGSKVIIFDESWNIVASSYREYKLDFPGQNRIEINFEYVWDKIRSAIVETNSQIDSSKIEALAISAIGDVIVPVDAYGTQIRTTIIDFDTRGSDEIKEFSLRFGTKRLFEITGMPPLFINSLAKILWIKKYEPAVFEKVDRWATVEDYILNKLGIRPVTSYSNAARTMLFDIRKKCWSDEVLEMAGIKPENLPAVAPSGVVLGELDTKKAAELGFKSQVRICSGGHDMVCAAIGAGLNTCDTQTAVDIDGTIEGIVIAMKEANTSDVMLENMYPCYPGYDGYVTFSINLTAGCVLRWLRDELFVALKAEAEKEKKNIYEMMLQHVDAFRPGNILFVPHFSGSGNPYFNPSAKGSIYGLTLDTKRTDILQGLIEGLCYEMKMHIEGFKEAGFNINKLYCAGGGSRSVNKLQLKANITGLEMESVSISEASAFGASVIAAKAVGIVDDPNETVKRALSKRALFKPISENMKNFNESYYKYRAFASMINDFENK